MAIKKQVDEYIQTKLMEIVKVKTTEMDLKVNNLSARLTEYANKGKESKEAIAKIREQYNKKLADANAGLATQKKKMEQAFQNLFKQITEKIENKQKIISEKLEGISEKFDVIKTKEEKIKQSHTALTLALLKNIPKEEKKGIHSPKAGDKIAPKCETLDPNNSWLLLTRNCPQFKYFKAGDSGRMATLVIHEKLDNQICTTEDHVKVDLTKEIITCLEMKVVSHITKPPLPIGDYIKECLTSLNKLTILNLSNNNLDAKSLSILLTHSTVKTGLHCLILDFSNFQCTEEKTKKKIAEDLDLTHIEHLSVEDSQIGWLLVQYANMQKRGVPKVLNIGETGCKIWGVIKTKINSYKDMQIYAYHKNKYGSKKYITNIDAHIVHDCEKM
jgi:hypothetical protein